MSNETNQSLRMSEVSAHETVSAQPAVLSVEQLNLKIKQLLEGQVGVVWIRGEISNFKPHTSGHFYFSLKDSKSQISAVMFRGHNSKLKFKPTDGMEVIVRGRISVFEPRGSYQILCEMMEPVGAGALQKAFEQLKEKLKSEGLFDSSRKRAIPAFPRHVAVVTSPTGAAIRDILNVLSRRSKAVRVTVVPTLVQGESSAPSLREAFEKATKITGIDVIIIGRGGGSIEDMWCFNDEGLARLIAASPIPVISAVGHEIDFTIADFVADLRAPTPSAAAELVAKSASELIGKVNSLDRVLSISLEKKLHQLREKILGLTQRLVDPKRKLMDLSLRNDDLLNRLELAQKNFLRKKSHEVELLTQRLLSPEVLIRDKRKDLHFFEKRIRQAIGYMVETKRSHLMRAGRVLDSLSPLRVVERGYSIVTSNGKVVKSYTQIKKGDVLNIQLAEGVASAIVEKAVENEDGL